MILTNYSAFRKDLASILDQVVENAETAFIARPGGKNVVVISQEEYESWKETEYLLSTKANREALAESLEDYKRGHLTETQDIDSFLAKRKEKRKSKAKAA